MVGDIPDSNSVGMIDFGYASATKPSLEEIYKLILVFYLKYLFKLTLCMQSQYQIQPGQSRKQAFSLKFLKTNL